MDNFCYIKCGISPAVDMVFVDDCPPQEQEGVFHEFLHVQSKFVTCFSGKSGQVICE